MYSVSRCQYRITVCPGYVRSGCNGAAETTPKWRFFNLRSTSKGLPHRRRVGLLRMMGAIAASILAILLVVAPASQATSPSPTPSPSNTTFQNNISGFLRDDARDPHKAVPPEVLHGMLR